MSLKLKLIIMAIGCSFVNNMQAREMTPAEQDQWLNSDEPIKSKKKINLGTLTLLSAKKYPSVMHSQNKIVITPESLKSGWVSLQQCYYNLDAFPKVDVVYKYRKMIDLKVLSYTKIAKAKLGSAKDMKSVELTNVQKGGSLCVSAKVLSLIKTKHGYQLSNGPFRRKYLDGYFPMKVSVEVQYPKKLLKVLKITPLKIINKNKKQKEGRIKLSALFEGELTTQVYFKKR